MNHVHGTNHRERRAARAEHRQERRIERIDKHRNRVEQKLERKRRRWGRLTDSTASAPGSPDDAGE